MAKSKRENGEGEDDDDRPEAELASLVQVIAIINAFNRINVATERGSNHYLEYASQR